MTLITTLAQGITSLPQSDRQPNAIAWAGSEIEHDPINNSTTYTFADGSILVNTGANWVVVQ